MDQSAFLIPKDSEDSFFYYATGDNIRPVNGRFDKVGILSMSIKEFLVMRIAITGAGGFIGSKVLEKLADYDEIDILALSRVQMIEHSIIKVRWVKTDYSVDSLNKVLKNVDVIIHLAAARGTQGLISIIM